MLDRMISAISSVMVSTPRSQRGSRTSSTNTNEPVASPKRVLDESQSHVPPSGDCSTVALALTSSTLASSAASKRNIGTPLRMVTLADSLVPIQLQTVMSAFNNSWRYSASGCAVSLSCQPDSSENQPLTRSTANASDGGSSRMSWITPSMLKRNSCGKICVNGHIGISRMTEAICGSNYRWRRRCSLPRLISYAAKGNMARPSNKVPSVLVARSTPEDTRMGR